MPPRPRSKSKAKKPNKIVRKEAVSNAKRAGKIHEAIEEGERTRRQGGTVLPPVSPKPEGAERGSYRKGEDHMALYDLDLLVQKMKRNVSDPKAAKVWLEGSEYWGQLTDARTIDNGKHVLLTKRN